MSETVNLFPNGTDGILGELQCGMAGRTTEGLLPVDDADLPRLRLAALERHEAYVEALLKGDVAALVAAHNPLCAIAMRNYVTDESTQLSIKGSDAIGEYFSAFYEKYDVQEVRLVNRLVERWFDFGELHFLVRGARRRRVGRSSSAPRRSPRSTPRGATGSAPAPAPTRSSAERTRSDGARLDLPSARRTARPSPDHEVSVSSPDPAADAAGVRFLDDVRVLEIASLAPAQLAMHLADLGAEVIKIEPPKRGDATRLIAKQPGYNDSSLHRRWNRGKRSLALDTTTPEGQAVLRRLIPTVDVVIEGLRPGTLDKMGLDWDELTEPEARPRRDLAVGLRAVGPLPRHAEPRDRVRRGVGAGQRRGRRRRRPRVASGHVYYGSLIAPLFGSTSVLAALSWSRRTGKPVRIDVAQADVAAFVNFGIEDVAAERAAAEAGVVEAPALMSVGGGRSTIQAYRTRDGRLLMLMALERKFFVRLAEAIGRDDLVAQVPEDQYMVRTTPEIDDALATAIATEDLRHWMDVFAAADVPVVPVNESADALDDPQLQSRMEWLPADQGTVTMKTPIHAEPAPAAPLQAPAVGSDSAAVLAELGLTDEEVAALEAAGVVRIDG